MSDNLPEKTNPVTRGDASLMGAFNDLPQNVAERDRLGLLFRISLAQSERHRQVGNFRRAWMELRCAEHILNQFEPEDRNK